MKLKLPLIIAAFIALIVYVPVAHGQANLTFSGGNGAPLSTILQQSVVYTITQPGCLGESNTPFFVFQGVGNPLQGAGDPLGDEREVTGNISFSYRNGTTGLIDMEGSGNTVNDFSLNDLYLFVAFRPDAFGNTVVLSAGKVTTASNVSAAPPAAGSYTTFIVNRSGIRCSADGIAVSPTAATVSIGGRAMTASGRGIRNVRIQMTDASGTVRNATTSAFGYYRFTDVAAGETYIFTARGKAYSFSQPTQVVNVNEEITEINFIANPTESRR